MESTETRTIASLTIDVPPASATLHKKAQQLLVSYQSKPSVAALPDTLRDLLVQVIKPLFSANPHPSLAPSGRKAHYPSASLIPHSDPIVLDDSDKPWKLAFSSLTEILLSATLATYPTLPPESLKPTIEQQIFLLTPALLNLIDDISPTSKATGFRLLNSLCTILTLANSNILAPSGLTEVFIDAIKPNFLLLPTLTPEPDALLILQQLYPAYLSLLHARFPPPTSPTDQPLRQKHLTTLLRHGILASLAHLNFGTPHTTHPALSTLLLQHLPPLTTALGISITSHLQSLLPLLRAALSDPFATAVPDLLLANLAATQAILQHAAAERIREKWWLEILRGCVAAWLNAEDDAAAGAKGNGDMLEEVKLQCRETVRVLAEVVEEEVWRDARKTLVEHTSELEGLFG